MRRLLLIFSLLLLSLQASVSQYTVKIRFAKLLWDSYSPYGEDYNQNEWSVNLHADVFDSNNDYVSPSSSIYYTWFKKDTSGGSFRLWYEGTGPVHSYADPDGLKIKSQGSPGTCSSCSYQAYELKVIASIDGNEYQSQVVRVPDDFLGSMTGQKEIVTDQLLENQSSTGNLGLNKGGTLYDYPASFTHYAFSGVSQTFRARQDVVSNQKYIRWNTQAGDVQDVVNHHPFTFSGNTTLKALLKTPNDATIRTYVSDGGYVSSTVELKDPWLIDDNSDNLGPRNRGTNAVFVSKSTPFHPLNDGSTNGAFANQTVASGNYYSIRTAQYIYVAGFSGASVPGVPQMLRFPAAQASKQL